MSQANKIKGQGVKAHHAGSYAVDGHLIRGRQYTVFDFRHHRSGPWAITCNRPVADGKHPGVDLLLNGQQIDQGLVNDTVRPMTMGLKQSTEGILHGPGYGGENVCLHRRQMDNIPLSEKGRDFNSPGVNRVQNHHRMFRRVRRPFNTILKVNGPETISFSYRGKSIFDFTGPGLHHNRIVMNQHKLLFRKSILQECPDHAFKLPRRCRTGRKVLVPGYIDLQNGFFLLIKKPFIFSQMHQLPVVIQYGLR